MQTTSDLADSTDLVLIGGGHSHLTVIKQLAMRPLPGLRVTVISKDIHTPYSGMLPGLVAGHYSLDEAHIDLRTLCQWAGIRLFHSEVSGLDTVAQIIHCNNRPAVRYDVLSINCGSQPALHSIDGATNIGIAVKPIEPFLDHWQRLQQQLLQRQQTSVARYRIAVVGGGAASVEIALACQYRLSQQLTEHSMPEINLYCSDSVLLASHNSQVQHTMSQQLQQRGIAVHLNHRVVSATQLADSQQLLFESGQQHDCDDIFWALHAGSADWPSQSQLQCDQNGFISVNQYLQSGSHSNVFAAGDIAHFQPQPLAKSGVYAVRAGQQLSDNLRRYITGKPLKPFRPQRRFLSLLMTGDKQAVASRGGLCFGGSWVWRWKDFIDRRFMASFQRQTSANAAAVPADPAAPPATPAATSPAMRCGGCGAKVASSVLSKVMQQLEVYQQPDVVIGLDAPDDAAVINPPADKQWLQSVDYFRAFIDDPYLLGYIATNHCLSDLYAMGATPHSALAIATVPYASEKLVKDSLLQLMHGAVDSLNQQQTALIGGHSSEGAELGFGLSVNGTIDPQRLMTKTGLAVDDCLILSKPLGSGILLAANMQAQAQGRWVDEALQQMMISNRQAAAIFHHYQASACTDITGFGLLGHLLEMLNTSELSANLSLQQLPVLAGAAECASQGWLSSLQPDNQRAETALANAESFRQHRHYPLLFDPQTAGGLLAAVPAQHRDACLQALQQADCAQAAVIGTITNNEHRSTITLC
jgi:selenide,water dikinase